MPEMFEGWSKEEIIAQFQRTINADGAMLRAKRAGKNCVVRDGQP